MDDIVSTAAPEPGGAVPLAVVVFGRDEGGKAHASCFEGADAAQAERAAGLMGFRALRLVTAEQQALGSRLAVGKTFKSGRGFVPFVAADVFAQLDADPAGFSPERPAEADVPPAAPRKPKGARSAAPTTPGAADAPDAAGGPAEPPLDHASIAVGHRVLAVEEYDLELWYVAEVVAVEGPDLLQLRWAAEVYASEPLFTRRRDHLALLPVALAADLK